MSVQDRINSNSVVLLVDLSSGCLYINKSTRQTDPVNIVFYTSSIDIIQDLINSTSRLNKIGSIDQLKGLDSSERNFLTSFNYILAQNAQNIYTLENRSTRVFTELEVGDSDEERDSDNEIRLFRLDRPLTPDYTTIYCQDGPLKGDVLIYNCHTIIVKMNEEYISALREVDEYQSTRQSPPQNVLLGYPHESNIVEYMGKYVLEQSTISEVGIEEQHKLQSVEFASSGAKFQLEQPVNQRGQPVPTTRLHLPAGFSVLGYQVNKTDLTYKEVNLVNQHILSSYNVRDEAFARMQLDRLYDTEKLSVDCEILFLAQDELVDLSQKLARLGELIAQSKLLSEKLELANAFLNEASLRTVNPPPSEAQSILKQFKHIGLQCQKLSQKYSLVYKEKINLSIELGHKASIREVVYIVDNEYYQRCEYSVVRLVKRNNDSTICFLPNETVLHSTLAELFVNYTKPREKLMLPGLNIDQQRKLKIWFDYMNALMFNIESSRLNVTIITSLMTLELIKKGKLTYQQAFDGGEFGGQFSGANLRTGSHNYKARAQLLSCEGMEGMRTDRQHPQWLAATLKEAITMINWFKIFWLEKHDIDSKSMLREDLLREFRIQVRVLAQTYLQVFSET
jgi:hypothetical protein